MKPTRLTSMPPITGGVSKPKAPAPQKVEYKQQEPAPAQPEPKEYPDTLKSTSYARMLDLLCEGPIEGLVDRQGNPLEQAQLGRGVFVDETPLRQENGTPNFNGIRVGMTYGTQDQEAMLGFGAASEVIFSGAQITKTGPVTVAITNTEAHAAVVAIRIPSLLSQDAKTGDIKGSELQFNIYVSRNGGAYAQVGGTVTVKGKSSGAYLKYVGITLPQGDTPYANNWNVRVSRVTNDASSLRVQNDSYLDFLTVRTRNQYRYPNTAMVGVEINAEGFQSMPHRSYRIKGLLIQVPSNYFPETRKYTRDADTGADTEVEQVWDGTFYQAWTDNPAWCFYDLATNKRYGLGDYLDESTTDKWSLYQIAQYCDELVDDGRGGMEPRFACNLAITSREQAWKVMQDMASIFRGMIYWHAGGITAVQDCPKDAASFKPFTQANVIDGQFNYSGTPKKARHTIAMVRWNDPLDFYRPKYEPVEDIEGMIRYGYRQIQVAAFGCTSRGQAVRMGRWVLFTDLYETETVSFRAGVEATVLRPGDVIEIVDNDRNTVMQAGRIVSISADRLSLTLDRGIEIGSETGGITITVAQPAGTLESSEVMNSTQIQYMRNAQSVTLDVLARELPQGASMTVTAGSSVVQCATDLSTENAAWDNVSPKDWIRIQGRTVQIAAIDPAGKVHLQDPWQGETQSNCGYTVTAGTVDLESTALPAECVAGAIFAVSTTSRQSQTFRVINVSEKEDGIHEVTGIQYRPDKFASIDQDLDLEDPPLPDIPDNPSECLPPIDVQISLQSLVTPLGVTPALALTWKKPIDPFLERFRVEWRKDDDNWQVLEETTATRSELKYQAGGVYQMRVSSFNFYGVQSDTVEAEYTVSATNPIALCRVQGLELVAAGGQGNSTTFASPDAKFQWRLVSPASSQEFGEDSESGEGFDDPMFDHYNVRIFAPGGTNPIFYVDTKDPNFTFTRMKNAECAGGPFAAFTIAVRAVDRYGNFSQEARIDVSNPAPASPTDVLASSAWRIVYLEWTNPTDPDLDFIEVYRSPTADFDDATLIATVRGDNFTATAGEAGVQYWFWTRAVDTFGSKSARAPIDGTTTTTGTIQATDLGDFAVTATKMFTNTIVLQSDLWTNNSPTAGKIAWNTHKLYFRGVEYTIAGDNATEQYVWWKGPTYNSAGVQLTPGESTYRKAATHPKDAGLMAVNDFIIATNTSGAHDLAWRGFANAVIGSAYIKDAAIKNAHIETVTADKLRAGSILGQTLKLSNTATGGVNSFTVTQGGNGYVTAPAVTISGGNGSGATATAVVSGGRVSAINVTAAGSGYSRQPKVTIGAPTGPTTASAICTMRSRGVGPWPAGDGYELDTITLTGGGAGYANGASVSFDFNGIGSQAAHPNVTATVVNGSVTGFTIVSRGRSDTSIAPDVEFSLTGGTVQAIGKALLPDGVQGTLESADYVAGISGFSMAGDGSLEINNAEIRGTLDASTIYTNSTLQNKDYPGKAVQSVIFGAYASNAVVAFNNASGQMNLFRGTTPFPNWEAITSTGVLQPTDGVGWIALPNAPTSYDGSRVSSYSPAVAMAVVCSAHSAEMTIVLRRRPHNVFPGDSLDYPWIIPADARFVMPTAMTQNALIFDPVAFCNTATKAVQKLTGTATVPGNGATVTIDGKVYTIQTTLTNVDGNVKQGASTTATLANLVNAINLGPGAGTAYAAATTLHPTVSATSSGAEMAIEAKTSGPAANAILVNEGSSVLSWIDTSGGFPPNRMFGGFTPADTDIIEIGVSGVSTAGAMTGSFSYGMFTFQVSNF